MDSQGKEFGSSLVQAFCMGFSARQTTGTPPEATQELPHKIYWPVVEVRIGRQLLQGGQDVRRCKNTDHLRLGSLSPILSVPQHVHAAQYDHGLDTHL